MSRFARLGARALMVLTLAAAAVVPARAQQASSPQAASTSVAPAGPRVAEAMPRVRASFKDDTPYRYADHKTTITISTIVLVVAVIVLILVLI
jgi:hypothetical protein